MTFHIQKAGQEKARREKQRNVHAYAKGYITDKENVHGLRITYKPFDYNTFIDEFNNPVYKVSKLFIDNDGYMLGSAIGEGEFI